MPDHPSTTPSAAAAAEPDDTLAGHARGAWRVLRRWWAELAVDSAPSTPRRPPVWIPAAALALGLALAVTPLHRRAAQALQDQQLRLTAREASLKDVLVVDIDEASVTALRPLLGEWPYRRDAYVAVLDRLHEFGARAVVLNTVQAESREGDHLLRRAVERSGKVVLAAGGVAQPVGMDSGSTRLLARLAEPAEAGVPATTWPAWIGPNEQLLSLVAGPGSVGLATLPPDGDGRIRTVPVWHRVAGRQLPSLPVAALMVQSGNQRPTYHAGGAAFRLGPLRWPVDADGRVGVAWPRNDDAAPTVPFNRISEAALGQTDDSALRELVRDRVVFIGASVAQTDRLATPVGRLAPAQAMAQIYSALRDDGWLRPAGWLAALPLLALAMAPAALAWRRGRSRLRSDLLNVLWAAVAVLLVSTVMLGLLRQASDPLLPLTVLALSAVLMLATAHRAATEERRRRGFDTALAEATHRVRSDFLANVSHEVRTPMNSLLGMAELLAETELDAEQRRYVEVLRGSGHALFDRVNELLDISSIEAGRMELHQAPFSVTALMTELEALAAPRAQQKGLALQVRVDPAMHDGALGDRSRLFQVLVNLVGNAIKFTARGSVTVEVARDADDARVLRFVVTDTGIGIAESKLEAIFEPFTQAEAGATRQYGGTGLGLSITRSLVQMMGGLLRVRSRPGLGSSFEFGVQLPIADLASPAAAASDAAPAADASRPALTILLAEDNPINEFLVRSLLKSTGHRIDSAANGLVALEKFRQGGHDMVLTDVQMPGMDGHELVREIRRLESAAGLPRTPVIALTAHAYEADRHRSLAAGCDEHLTKPINRARLVETIDRLRPASVHDVPADKVFAPDPVAAAPRVPQSQPVEAGAPADLEAPAPLIDRPVALARLGGDEALYQRVLDHAQVFFGDWPRSFDLLRALGQPEPARRLAHDLKSIAAAVGATQLARRATRLEQALADGDLARIETARVETLDALPPVLAELTRGSSVGV